LPGGGIDRWPSTGSKDADIPPFLKDVMQFKRITINPLQMGGVPCIRGMRFPVTTLLAYMGSGMTEKQILETWPNLKPADIREAFRYAAEAVRERVLPLKQAASKSGVARSRRKSGEKVLRLYRSQTNRFDNEEWEW